MEFEETDQSEQVPQKEKENQDVSTDDYKDLIIRMRKANLLFQQMSRIPLGELSMLLAISRLSKELGKVKVSSLGNAMKLSRPAVSRMLHNLEKKGYVQMKNSDEDQRYVFVYTTEKGKALLQNELNYGYRIMEKVRKRMGSDCMQGFLRYSNEFHRILSEELLKLGEKELETENKPV